MINKIYSKLILAKKDEIDKRLYVRDEIFAKCSRTLSIEQK